MLAPSLVAITDAATRGEAVTLERMTRLCESARPGCIAIQLRDRSLPVRRRLALGVSLQRVAAATGQQLWVNDRLDLALLLAASVLHVPHSGVPIARLQQALRACNGTLRLSEPVHDVSSTSLAEIGIISPIFRARKSAPPLGTSALAGYCRKHHTQAVYALGGVTSDNAVQATSAGAVGVAAIGSIYDEPLALLAALSLLA